MMRSGEKDENRTGVESSVGKIITIVLTLVGGVIRGANVAIVARISTRDVV
jgi:hypothetical protein